MKKPHQIRQLATSNFDFPDSCETSCIGPRVGYVRRGGAHGLSALDWFLAFDFTCRLFFH